ncbi:MAG: DNA-3-methyladenine glycosylase [Nanoarchaeota archaeon]|nr:DNA-3-methyladenine glycosylase [Nanoarchaeota archaeon]
MDYKQFFGRESIVVAPDLIGRFLSRKTEKGSICARMMETAAYENGSETPSRAGMKYSPGRLFLMPYRGSDLFNIATDIEGFPSCVEIRKLLFMDDIINGSGVITEFLGLNSSFDGIPLGKEIRILGERVRHIKHSTELEMPDNCVGYFSINP